MKSEFKAKIQTPDGEVEVPFFFGYGPLEIFSERHGYKDPQKATEVLLQSPVISMKEFMLICCEYHYELYSKGVACPFTAKDLTRLIDLSGGFKSTLITGFTDAFVNSFSGDDDPDTAEIVDTPPAKN